MPGTLVSRYSSTVIPRSMARAGLFGQCNRRPYADADDDEIGEH
jgi:hypothetical protein